MTRVASFDDGQVVLIPSQHQEAVSKGKIVEVHGNEITVSHRLSLAQGDGLIVVTPIDDILAEVLWTKPAEKGSWSGVRVLQRSHVAVPSRAIAKPERKSRKVPGAF